jgi:molybdenum cofactor sulfurtransferase
MVTKGSARLAFDREFALVDSSGTAMRLQHYPRMSLLEPTIDLELRTMTVRAPGCSDLLILLNDDCSVMDEQNSVIKVCGNKCGGRLWGDLATSDWFSSFLGVRCWLARHSGGRYELSDSRGGVAFANEAPLLLLSQHSVETLNEVLVSQGQRHVNSRHFRPNLVVQSTAPGSVDNDASMLNNPEDRWTKLSLVDGKNNLELNVVGQCARCSMVDVDPATGTKQKTLRALADYRRRNGQITFGVFLQAATSQENDASSSSTAWLEEGDIMKCT